jgi:superfamily II DNA/RNA helicase
MGALRAQALHAFRDNRATFLLATPAAARGLDLPAVSHVYNLDPPEDAVAYLHRAGRAGRIGSPVKGACVAYLGTQCLPNAHVRGPGRNISCMSLNFGWS